MGRPVNGARRILTAIIATLALLPQASHASADGEGGSGTTETTSTGLLVTGVDPQQGQQGGDNSNPVTTAASSTPTLPPGTWVNSKACDTIAASGCVVEYSCSDGSAPQVWTYVLLTGETAGSYTQCPEDPPPSATTTPTATIDIPAEVLKAFEKVELPESTINVQPPGGETLVNLPTILSTSAERHQIPVHLDRVNIDVLLEVWPSQLHLAPRRRHQPDDEHSRQGLDRGTDMADLITHTYAKTSTGLQLSVDTTWSAQFKVAGQPDWRPVDGTVPISGEPVTVAVRSEAAVCRAGRTAAAPVHETDLRAAIFAPPENLTDGGTCGTRYRRSHTADDSGTTVAAAVPGTAGPTPQRPPCSRGTETGSPRWRPTNVERSQATGEPLPRAPSCPAPRGRS